MRIRRLPPSETEDEAITLSGWLYADLLLGLAVIFLGAAFFYVSATDDEPATAATTTTTTTTEDPRNEVEALEREMRSLETELATKSADLEDATERIGELGGDLHKARGQLALEQDRAKEAEEEIGGLGQELRDANQTNEELSSDLAAAEKELNEILSAAPAGVEKGFHCFRIKRVDERDVDAATTSVNAELARLEILDRMAGIAISFGVSKNSSGPGSSHAEWFNEFILGPHPAFGQAALRGFWSGFGSGDGTPTSVKPDGSVEVNVYLMTKPGTDQRTGDVEARC